LTKVVFCIFSKKLSGLKIFCFVYVELKMSISCDECQELVRKECFLTHITNNHQGYLWNQIFKPNPYNEQGEFTGLKYKMPMMEVRDILNGNDRPLVIEGENDTFYMDFGGKAVYNKDLTAVKHIQDHPLKHMQNLFEYLKEDLTADILIKLFTCITAKTAGQTDAQKARIIKKEFDEYVYTTTIQLDRLEKIEKKYNEVITLDSNKIIEDLKKQLCSSYVKSQELQSKLNSNTNELYDLRAEIESRYVRNKEDGERMDADLKLCDQIRKECDIKLAKERNGLDARLKKAKEDYEKDLKKETEKYEKEQEKFEKKERKYKKEIKAYKHQLELKKLKESDSDSDSE
jgi:hypothetical protein